MSLSAMKLALEALEGVVSAHNYEGGTPLKAIIALRQAIALQNLTDTHQEIESLHTCSYYCERPECIKSQRDDLRNKLEELTQSLETHE